ncbi:MAG: hypothetical protein U1F56_14060 [Rubrivivax sp.]
MHHLLRAAAAALLIALPPAHAADALPGCHDTSFVDTIAVGAWVTLDLAPGQGTAGVRDALRRAQSQYPTQPVRIRLAPGRYADNLGSEIFAQALWRSAEAPIWLQATDPTPDATVLDHGLNLLGVSYVAIDGVTIGPAQVGAWDGRRHADPQPLQAAAGVHVAGVALDARRNAAAGGQLDFGVYGRYRASHHLLVRRVTVQNLFDREERDGETSEGLSMDGMKFNQVQDLWVLDSRIQQTTRHGIDGVGVHRAAFCRNVVSRIGGGLGIEAKGGSVDILYEGNLFHRVRRVELGGEDTDATYYFSSDGARDHEARRVTARHNLIVDAREAALEFSGCQDCVAAHNTIFYSAGYRAPRDGDTVYGGDAIRVHDSRLLGADDGAGSDCQFWDESLQDHVTVDPCWGVGAHPPAPVNRVLRSDRLTVANNVIVSVAALWGAGGGSVVPCPLNIVGGDAAMAFDGNLWFNGGQPLPAEGCSTLAEGAASGLAARQPLVATAIDEGSLRAMIASVIPALQPASGSGLAGRAASVLAPAPAHDQQRGLRDGAAAIGALAGRSADELALDRLANWAERAHVAVFPQAALSQRLSGYYLRHQPLTQTYVGTANGRLYVLGPAFGASVVDLGPLADWLTQAQAAGY